MGAKLRARKKLRPLEASHQLADRGFFSAHETKNQRRELDAYCFLQCVEASSHSGSPCARCRRTTRRTSERGPSRRACRRCGSVCVLGASHSPKRRRSSFRLKTQRTTSHTPSSEMEHREWPTADLVLVAFSARVVWHRCCPRWGARPCSRGLVRPSATRVVVPMLTNSEPSIRNWQS